MGVVSIHGLEVYGYHGCLDEEAVVGTLFKVDIDVEYNFKKAAEEDELSKTVDYVEVAKIAQEEIAIRSRLIEQVAYRMMNRIKKRYPDAGKVKITLHKLNPPAEALLQSVSVSIEE